MRVPFKGQVIRWQAPRVQQLSRGSVLLPRGTLSLCQVSCMELQELMSSSQCQKQDWTRHKVECKDEVSATPLATRLSPTHHPSRSIDKNRTESIAVAYPTDALITPRVAELRLSIHFELNLFLFSAFRVDDPSAALETTHAVYIDCTFDPSASSDLRQQFTFLGAGVLPHAELLHKLYYLSFAHDVERRTEMLESMTQKSMNERHGLGGMPGDFIRCAVFFVGDSRRRGWRGRRGRMILVLSR